MAKRILVVDDEPRVLAMISKRLETHGYQVSTAVDGIEGLRKARAERPDLVILDLLLPDVSGFEVCTLLKGDADLRATPVLMLTARSQAADIAEGRRVGADAYITKPYESELLLEQVARLLAQADEKNRETER
jgi:two-component system, OmpR family, alkaline phosphatase synthesis response regulator PhoP